MYGLPLAHIVLPANLNDQTQLRPMLQKAQKLYPWFKPNHLMGDRGYDGYHNFAFLYGEGIIPIIHIRKPTAKDGLYAGLYNKGGIPVCGDGKVPMEFFRTDPETGFHLFTCLPAGCSLRPKYNGAIRYCEPEIHAGNPRDNMKSWASWGAGRRSGSDCIARGPSSSDSLAPPRG